MRAEEAGPSGHERRGHRRDATDGPPWKPQALRLPNRSRIPYEYGG
jgi:hypothetical protein